MLMITINTHNYCITSATMLCTILAVEEWIWEKSQDPAAVVVKKNTCFYTQCSS
jgi:hypothetical protein